MHLLESGGSLERVRSLRLHIRGHAHREAGAAAELAFDGQLAVEEDTQGGRTAVPNSILVIDDDPAGLDLLDRILTKEGFSIVLSTNAVDGLMLARQMRPSIIILDIRMPGLNGWQVLQLIRDDPELRGSRVLLLTVDDDFNKGQVLGADAHLLKPIDRDALLKCLERLRPVDAEEDGSLVVAG